MTRTQSKGTWTCRVVRQDGVYSIREVYRSPGAVDFDMLTCAPVAPVGDDVEDLRRCFDRMASAFDLPPLDYETLKEVKPRARRRVRSKRSK